MKKIISTMALMIMLTMSVSASNPDPIQVDCDGPGWFNSDLCRDYELQDEFNEQDERDDKQDNKIKKNKKQSKANEDDITLLNSYSSNYATKGECGGGLSRQTMWKDATGLLNQEYVFDFNLKNFYKTIFVTFEEYNNDLEKIWNYNYETRCMVELPSATHTQMQDCILQKKANNLCQEVNLNGKTFTPNTICVN